MASTFKTDVDSVAAAYLKNNVNLQLNPYHSGWAPGYTNMANVGPFTQDPPESHPSNNISGAVKANDLRSSMLALGTYYAWIARGHYGLLTTDELGTRYQFEGLSYFSLTGAEPGMNAHWNNVINDLNQVGFPAGQLTFGQLITWYQYGWNVINSRKDEVTADLTVCHSSCHTSCHGSRGRR